MYMRPMYHTLWQRLQEPRRFIQILAGPRQVGKTTLAHQDMDDLTMPAHFASADDPGLQDTTRIQQPAKPFASCIASHAICLLRLGRTLSPTSPSSVFGVCVYVRPSSVDSSRVMV